MNPVNELFANSDKLLVCELTGGGRGAICVLAVAGPGAADMMDPFFLAANGKPAALQPRSRPIYGRWGREDIILCLHSDTHVEVHCHGGDFAKRVILHDLQSCGVAHQDESLFATNTTALPQALQAFRELPRATTARTAAILNWQAQGVLDAALESVRQLLDDAAFAEALLRIDTLLERSSLGLHLTQPWKIVVVGAANAGKSSLMNQLVGFNRSIVFDQPGTTRDLVSFETAIDGWPVQLLDTAGLRSSTDPLERQGMSLAAKAVRQADLMIEVVDLTDPKQGFFQDYTGRRILAYNKCDAAAIPNLKRGMAISARTGQGIEELQVEISRLLVPRVPLQNAAVPFLVTQVHELEGLRQLAIQAMGEDRPLGS